MSLELKKYRRKGVKIKNILGEIMCKFFPNMEKKQVSETLSTIEKDVNL